VLIANARCSCEVKFGSSADDHAPRQSSTAVTRPAAPIVTQQAATIAPAAADVAAPAPPEPTGVLSEAAVRKTEARHRREVRFCMEQAPSAAESASVRLQFVVKPD
jgi:hypothetical protein